MKRHTTLVASVITRGPARERGQVLPITLTGVVLAAVLMFSMANTGNKVTEKSVVVNAADAAAWSGATLVAQHLNFMAYTNRAMIANHVGVGHFIAYLSWVRYVEDVAEKLDTIGQFIPIVAPITQALEQAAEIILEIAETTAPIFVQGVDEINLFYSDAQEEAQAILTGDGFAGGPTPLDRLMEDVAGRFDPAIDINDIGEMRKLGDDGFNELDVALARQAVNLINFVKPQKVTDNNGEIVDLIEQTYGDNGFFGLSGSMSDEWLTDRGWEDPGLEKDFDTDHVLTDEEGNWKASDRLRRVQFFFLKTTLASGKADAREDDVAPDYKGIHQYFQVSERPVDPVNSSLPIMAFASKPQQEVFTHDIFDSPSPDVPLSGLSIALVEHQRPSVDFKKLVSFAVFGVNFTGLDEFSNLYNPFWRARIVGTRYADLFLVSDRVKLKDPDKY